MTDTSVVVFVFAASLAIGYQQQQVYDVWRNTVAHILAPCAPQTKMGHIALTARPTLTMSHSWCLFQLRPAAFFVELRPCGARVMRLVHAYPATPVRFLPCLQTQCIARPVAGVLPYGTRSDTCAHRNTQSGGVVCICSVFGGRAVDIAGSLSLSGAVGVITVRYLLYEFGYCRGLWLVVGGQCS